MSKLVSASAPGSSVSMSSSSRSSASTCDVSRIKSSLSSESSFRPFATSPDSPESWSSRSRLSNSRSRSSICWVSREMSSAAADLSFSSVERSSSSKLRLSICFVSRMSIFSGSDSILRPASSAVTSSGISRSSSSIPRALRSCISVSSFALNVISSILSISESSSWIWMVSRSISSSVCEACSPVLSSEPSAASCGVNISSSSTSSSDKSSLSTLESYTPGSSTIFSTGWSSTVSEPRMTSSSSVRASISPSSVSTTSGVSGTVLSDGVSVEAGAEEPGPNNSSSPAVRSAMSMSSEPAKAAAAALAVPIPAASFLFENRSGLAGASVSGPRSSISIESRSMPFSGNKLSSSAAVSEPVSAVVSRADVSSTSSSSSDKSSISISASYPAGVSSVSSAWPPNKSSSSSSRRSTSRFSPCVRPVSSAPIIRSSSVSAAGCPDISSEPRILSSSLVRSSMAWSSSASVSVKSARPTDGSGMPVLSRSAREETAELSGICSDAGAVPDTWAGSAKDSESPTAGGKATKRC